MMRSLIITQMEKEIIFKCRCFNYRDEHDSKPILILLCAGLFITKV